MRGICFIAFAVLTFYTAGMYRNLPLMVLFLSEFLLMIVLRVILSYCRKKVRIEWTAAGITGERMEEIRCICRVTNKGRIPVRKLRLRCRCYDYQERAGKTVHFYGRAECGVNELCFSMCVPYCGNIFLRLERIQQYDPMALFTVSEKLFDKMTVAVFPQTQAMHVETDSLELQKMQEGAEQDTDGTGRLQSEIRQIREYRPEDSIRRIHWNLSARTDSLWVKEYEDEADGCMDILLDMDNNQRYGAARMDAFYRILSALVSGILQNFRSVRVSWPDAQSGWPVQKYVTETEQIRDMLLCLYRIDVSDEKCTKAKEFRTWDTLQSRSCFRLNLSLQWYLDQTLIYQFHEEVLDQEIAEKVFVI